MLGWLKKILTSWLVGPENEGDELDCLLMDSHGQSRVVRCLATGAVGMCLMVVPSDVGHPGGILVRETQASDRDKFWWLWRRYNKRGGWHWENGRRFNPGA